MKKEIITSNYHLFYDIDKMVICDNKKMDELIFKEYYRIKYYNKMVKYFVEDLEKYFEKNKKNPKIYRDKHNSKFIVNVIIIIIFNCNTKKDVLFDDKNIFTKELVKDYLIKNKCINASMDLLKICCDVIPTIADSYIKYYHKLINKKMVETNIEIKYDIVKNDVNDIIKIKIIFRKFEEIILSHRVF